jgi:hypothetical protein
MLLLCNARSLDRDLVVVACDYAFSLYVYRQVLWCLTTNHPAVKEESKSDTEGRTGLLHLAAVQIEFVPRPAFSR